MWFQNIFLYFLHEILSICILNENREIIYSAYVKPINHTEWKKAQRIHKLSPSSIDKYGIERTQFESEVQAIFSKVKTVIGYNVDFDLNMLKDYIDINEYNRLNTNKKCCMKEYQNVRGLSSYSKLSGACKFEGIQFEGNAHGTEADNKACYDLWKKIHPDD